MSTREKDSSSGVSQAPEQPPEASTLERLTRYTPGGEWWDQMVEAPYGKWLQRSDVLSALSVSQAPDGSLLAELTRIVREIGDAWDADRDSRVGKMLSALGGYQRGYRADIDALRDSLAATGVSQAPPQAWAPKSKK